MPMPAFDNLLVAVDGSPPSDKGLAEAIRIARAEGAHLRVLHVVDELLPAVTSGADGVIDFVRQAGREIIRDALAKARAAGVAADGDVIECLGQRTAAILVEEAERTGAGLIVLGTHGRRGVRRIVMGSDAEDVVRTATVPVLVVRAEVQ